MIGRPPRDRSSLLPETGTEPLQRTPQTEALTNVGNHPRLQGLRPDQRNRPSEETPGGGGLLGVLIALVVIAMRPGGAGGSQRRDKRQLPRFDRGHAAAQQRRCGRGRSGNQHGFWFRYARLHGQCEVAWRGLHRRRSFSTAQQALPQGGQTTLHGTITVTHKGARNVTPAASSLTALNPANRSLAAPTSIRLEAGRTETALSIASDFCNPADRPSRQGQLALPPIS